MNHEPTDAARRSNPSDGGRSRRRVLAAGGALVAALAGCAATGTPDDAPGTSPDDGTPPEETPDESPVSTPDPEPLAAGGRWPQRGFGPGHGGVSPRTGVPGGGRPYWHYRRIRSGSPVLADGRLYHYAELGRDPDGEPTPTPTPDTEYGPAHIVTGNPHLVARDAATGALEWWSELPNPGGGSPAVAGGRVVAGVSGAVLAVDAATGERRWTDDLPPYEAHGDESPRPVGPPTVLGDTVLVPLPGVVSDGEYVAVPRLRAYGRDGTERWTVRAPQRGLGLAAADGTAVLTAGDYDRRTVVQGRSVADGGEQWRTDLDDGFYRGPVVAGGAVYVATREEGLVALDLADGRERWRVESAGEVAVAADAETVYAAVGDALLALDAADGRERWRRSPGERADYSAPPAVGEDTVYVGTMGAEDAPFEAVDAATGERRWQHSLPRTVVEGDMVMAGALNQPTVADGAVYVDAVDGLYGFGPDDG